MGLDGMGVISWRRMTTVDMSGIDKIRSGKLQCMTSEVGKP